MRLSINLCVISDLGFLIKVRFGICSWCRLFFYIVSTSCAAVFILCTCVSCAQRARSTAATSCHTSPRWPWRRSCPNHLLLMTPALAPTRCSSEVPITPRHSPLFPPGVRFPKAYWPRDLVHHLPFESELRRCARPVPYAPYGC